MGDTRSLSTSPPAAKHSRSSLRCLRPSHKHWPAEPPTREHWGMAPPLTSSGMAGSAAEEAAAPAPASGSMSPLNRAWPCSAPPPPPLPPPPPPPPLLLPPPPLSAAIFEAQAGAERQPRGGEGEGRRRAGGGGRGGAGGVGGAAGAEATSGTRWRPPAQPSLRGLVRGGGGGGGDDEESPRQRRHPRVTAVTSPGA